MDKTNQELPQDLVGALDKQYIRLKPDAAFARELEARLCRHQRELLTRRQGGECRLKITDLINLRALHAHPILTLLILALTLLALAGTAYAIGRWSGFIPGFGFTSEGDQAYVLTEPSEAGVGGTTVIVGRAIGDKERFWVELSARGLPKGDVSSRAFVVLADGTRLPHEMGASVEMEDGGTRISYLFPPLPENTNEVTLRIENLGGQDFNLQLKLRPAETDEIVPVPPEVGTPLESESHDGVRLVIDQVAVDQSKTIFQVSLRFNESNTWLMSDWNVTLSDLDGALCPLTDVTPDSLSSNDTRVYQTEPFRDGERFVLKLATFPASETLTLLIDLSAEGPSFTFDPGPSPQVGQTWTMDRSLDANSFSVKIVSVMLMEGPQLIFDVEPSPPAVGVMFGTADPAATGAAGGIQTRDGRVTAGISLSHIPDHPIEIRLIRVYYQARGPWELRWQPPSAPAGGERDESMVDTPEAIDIVDLPPTATQAASNPILLEVEQLAARFDAPLQQGPGWVNTVDETRSDPSPGQVYPPPYVRTERWYETDADGFILRSVSQDFGEDGQILQQVASVGDYTINFTTGETGFNMGFPYRISLDTLSQQLHEAAESDRSNITRKEITCDNGRPCLLITGWEVFDQATKNPGEKRSFTGAGRRVWIDLETGQQIKDEVFWLLEGGGEAIASTTEFTLVEKVAAPPRQILELLARVIVP